MEHDSWAGEVTLKLERTKITQGTPHCVIQVQNRAIKSLRTSISVFATNLQKSRGTLNTLYILICLLKILLEMCRKTQNVLELQVVKMSMVFVLVFSTALKNISL